VRGTRSKSGGPSQPGCRTRKGCVIEGRFSKLPTGRYVSPLLLVSALRIAAQVTAFVLRNPLLEPFHKIVSIKVVHVVSGPRAESFGGWSYVVYRSGRRMLWWFDMLTTNGANPPVLTPPKHGTRPSLNFGTGSRLAWRPVTTRRRDAKHRLA